MPDRLHPGVAVGWAIIGFIGMGLLCSPAQADILFQNPLTGNNSGNNFNTGSFPEKVNNIAAEDLTVASNSVVQSISFMAYQDQGVSQPDSVNWFIYNDTSGLPGNVIASTIAASYSVSFLFSAIPYDVDSYTLSIPDLNLAPGTYWFGFHVNTFQIPTAPPPHWAHADSGNGIVAHSNDDGASWYTEPGSYAFRVDGVVATVPEPPTLVASSIMLGTLGLIWRFRRLSATGVG